VDVLISAFFVYGDDHFQNKAQLPASLTEKVAAHASANRSYIKARTRRDMGAADGDERISNFK
jgi:hypothetical protein